MKYSLEESLQRLRNELNKFLKHTISITKTEHKNSSTHYHHQHVKEKPKTHQAEKWSEVEVKEWFIKNNLNLAILEHLSPCPGVVLIQMLEMRKIAPEFFYQSLKEIKGINLSALTFFTYFLVKLMDEDL
jgi:hypothetical protein